MRRKVIQDFANVFCQNYIDLSSGYDVATLADLGSGTVCLDILSGECVHNGVICRTFILCELRRNWLRCQCEKHHTSFDEIEKAAIVVEYTVAVQVKTEYGLTKNSAAFNFDCRSEIATNEKTYMGRASGEKVWGFGSFYGETF